MVKEVEFSSTATGDSPRPSTAMEILREAAKTLGKARKLIFSILLLVLSPYSVLFFGNYFFITPLQADMVTKYLAMQTKDPKSPEYRDLLAAIKEDLWEFTGDEVITLLISHVLLLFLAVAVIYTSAVAYSGKQITLKDLFQRIRRTWKGPLVTQLYLVVMRLGYQVLLLALIGVVVLASNSSKALIALGAFLVVLALLVMYVYLELVWSLGVVVSVVEEDCYGMAALGKAGELIRGRKKLAFAIYSQLMLFTFVILLAYYAVLTRLPQTQGVLLASGYVMLCVSFLTSVFYLAVYTVFYYECKKKSHGGEVALLKEGIEYTMLPSSSLTFDEEALLKV